MKVLVTGSTGGIGKWVVKKVVEAGHTVRSLDIPAQPASKDDEHIAGDIRDLPLVRRAMQGMDAVIHLAAIPYDVDRQDELILDTNIRGTWNVLLAAHEAGVPRVVNFSSINALGQAEPKHPGLYLPLDDEVPHFTTRNYYLSKHIGEEMCFAFASRGVLTAISLRPTLVTYPEPSRFGWWDHMPDEMKFRFATSDFFSYVDGRDVADAAVLSLTAKVDLHQAFLLSADDNRFHIPTAELVAKYYPNLPWPKVSKEEYCARNEYISLLDCHAAKEVLGWQPKYSQFDLESGYEHK